MLFNDRIQFDKIGFESVMRYLVHKKQVRITYVYSKTEIDRSRRLGWPAFGKLSGIVKTNLVTKYSTTCPY